jgi:hypothetical protein
MKWYQKKRLAVWERLYALLNGDDFDYAVYGRYLDWTIRRGEAGKMARHRFMHAADSVHLCRCRCGQKKKQGPQRRPSPKISTMKFRFDP